MSKWFVKLCSALIRASSVKNTLAIYMIFSFVFLHSFVALGAEGTGYESYDLNSLSPPTPMENLPPTLTGFYPDRPSPQVSGSAIQWSAVAYDPDGDSVLYRYWLKGPSTDYSWKVVRDWTSSSTWTWFTDAEDAGEYDLAVYVRDGYHQTEGRYDDIAGYKGYQLTRAKANQAPVIVSLSSNWPDPQVSGTAVTWTVSAFDNDGDSLYYRFWLKGPSTGYAWKMVRDWSNVEYWTWFTSSEDVGDSQIAVLVRDGNHADSRNYDDLKIADFTIAHGTISPITPSSPDVQFYTQAVDPANGVVYYSTNSAGLQVFKIRVYVTGRDLYNIKSVKYVLHPTFENPEYSSTDPYNNFEMVLWTWGRFNMPIIVTMKDGRVYEYDYYFTFGAQLEEAQRRGIPFVYV